MGGVGKPDRGPLGCQGKGPLPGFPPREQPTTCGNSGSGAPTTKPAGRHAVAPRERRTAPALVVLCQSNHSVPLP
jgi:hypothetical protein